jgi:predicted XRE-type DNA-binding protein
MDKALLAMLFILFVFLIMAPIIVWINNRTNDNPEEMDDLSEGNLVKLEIKKNLLNMLDQWIQENDLNHDQIAIKLAVNLNVVADIVHQRFDKFTVDRLVDLVLRSGKSLKWVITSKDE